MVEDNFINFKLAKKILERLGMEVDHAANGEAAVERMGKEDYDIVFMDLQMPVMDGFEATTEIRKQIAPEKLPIVALTANVMEENRNRCEVAGMQAFMNKPLKSSDFVNILRQHLQEATVT